MTHEEFVHDQRTVHRPIFLSIPETARYVRRFVVSYPVPFPDYPDMAYDSVVEAWFDNMDDLHALYFSDNFVNKVDPDHYNFIDMTALGRIVSEEEIVVPDATADRCPWAASASSAIRRIEPIRCGPSPRRPPRRGHPNARLLVLMRSR